MVSMVIMTVVIGVTASDIIFSSISYQNFILSNLEINTAYSHPLSSIPETLNFPSYNSNFINKKFIFI